MAFTYKGTDNLPPKTTLKDGDYKFTVLSAESTVIPKGTLAGTNKWELTLGIEEHPESWDVFDDLVEHDKFQWRIDTFLRCTGVSIKPGDPVEFNAELARDNKIPWINVVGLRGWVRLGTETYTRKNGQVGSKNVVMTYYTDKEKLAPNVKLQAEAAELANPPF